MCLFDIFDLCHDVYPVIDITELVLGRSKLNAFDLLSQAYSVAELGASHRVRMPSALAWHPVQYLGWTTFVYLVTAVWLHVFLF